MNENEVTRYKVTAHTWCDRYGVVMIEASTYKGAAYVDPTFVRGATPSEVINVWDQEKGASVLDGTRTQLYQIVREWINDQDSESAKWETRGAEWVEAYIENATAKR